VACIAFLPGCDLRCGFCYNPEFVLPERLARLREDFIPEGVFMRFLESRHDKLDAVSICGGEPTIHAGLPDFLGRIRALGYAVKLDTNGGNPAMLARILAEHLADYVAMDVKYPFDRYAEIAGRSAGSERYRESVRLIMESGVDYEFRTTVMHPWHDADKMREIAREIAGAKRYYLQNFLPSETLDPDFEARSCTSEELEAMRDAASEYVSVEIRAVG
jgi:pyruvate formate lyase activating enzyme